MKIKIIIFAAIALIVVNEAFALEFIVRGNVNEMYDDNTNTSPDNPESDWITNMMLGAALRSEGRSREFELSANVYQQYSFNNEENRSNYQDLGLSINKALGERVNVTIEDVFQRYPESKSFGTLFGRSEDDTGYISNDFSAGFSVDMTRHFFFGVLYNNGIMKNNSDTMADSVSHNPGGYLGYNINSSNILRGGYMYTLMKYDDGNTRRGDRGYGEYEHHFTEQLRAVLHGGYDYNDSNEGQSLSSRWMASVVNDIDESNRLNITYLKESTISNIVNDTLNNWRISCSLGRMVSERTGAGLTLFYGKGTYEISGAKEELAGVSFALSYIVTDFINFNAGYNYTWNSSTETGSDEVSYKRNQAFAGLTVQY